MAAVVPARARPPIIRAKLAEELAEGLLKSCTDVTRFTLCHIQLGYSCSQLEKQTCKPQSLHELPSLLPRQKSVCQPSDCD